VEDDYFCPTCGNYAQKEPGKCPQCGSILEALVGVSRENGDYVDDDLLGGFCRRLLIFLTLPHVR